VFKNKDKLRAYKRLSSKEREHISDLLLLSNSIRTIAKILNRSYSTIYYEIVNNICSYEYNGKTYYKYNPGMAQEKADYAKKHSHRKEKIILSNTLLQNFIICYLKKSYTPMLIAREIKKVFTDKYLQVCFITIYRFIRDGKVKHLELFQFLPQKHEKVYKRHKNPYHKNNQIKEYTSIKLRDGDINKRVRIGDLEADSLCSSKNTSAYLHVLIERKSRYPICATKIDSLSKENGYMVEDLALSKLPKGIIKSITYDNGSENFWHYKLKEKYGIDTFFCLPYRPEQKGTVENFIGRLRWFFPKNTDFSLIPQEKIDEVLEIFRNRPMKCLGYKTPKEVFFSEIERELNNHSPP
jgi:IS30 family transposase